eukprot:1521110-Pyramimonas_sp.AAC.1
MREGASAGPPLPPPNHQPPAETSVGEGSPLRAAAGGGAPSSDDIDAFIRKLNEHEGVVQRDSARATAGSTPTPVSSSGSSGSWDKIGNDLDHPLKDQIVQLKLESANPRDSLLNVLQQYRPSIGSQVGGVRTRVAPTVLAKLHRGGRTARIETQEWLRSKELQTASVAIEVNMLAM